MTVIRHGLLTVAVITGIVWAGSSFISLSYANNNVGLNIRSGAVQVVWRFGDVSELDSPLTSHFFNRDLEINRIKRPRLQWPPMWFIGPDWAVISLLWIIPILLLPWWLMDRKVRRRKRWAREGRCLICGYNLQGSESGTCSECGAGYEQREEEA